MIKVCVIAAVGLVAGCGTAIGDDGKVIDVKPMVKMTTVPREDCRDEVVTLTRETKDPHQITGTAVGAVVGGVIGNQIGDGSGKDIATVGGAVAGGYSGNKIQEGMQERNTYQETQRNCVTVNDRVEVPAGYEVTYLLGGGERTIHLDYDPGKKITIVDGAIVPRS